MPLMLTWACSGLGTAVTVVGAPAKTTAAAATATTVKERLPENVIGTPKNKLLQSSKSEPYFKCRRL
jgi:hypothetical protein